MVILWWLLGLIGLIVALLIVAAIILTVLGLKLPAEHKAEASILVNRSPVECHSKIANLEAWPSWNKSVTRIERLPDEHNLPVHRMKMGHNSFVLKTTRNQPPTADAPKGHFETTITDDYGPFSGSWLFITQTQGSQTRISLTEIGRIKGPLPRAMLKYILGYSFFIKKFLAALEKSLV